MEDNGIQLRRFHNYIKQCLYNKYCNKDQSLLDIACGRGGDMMKWYKTELNNVVAIDICKSSIYEAIRRYKANPLIKGMDYRFYFTQPQNVFVDFLKFKQLPLVYDNISCMFALHYFFKNQSTAHKIFKHVSECLKEDGYFFGTIMNGTDVHKLFANQEVVSNSAMFIQKDYKHLFPFGNQIQFMLSGTLYFGEKSLSTEYLIFQDTLTGIGKIYNLELIEFQSFRDKYSDAYKLNEDFQAASFLYYTFAFKKI